MMIADTAAVEYLPA